MVNHITYNIMKVSGCTKESINLLLSSYNSFVSRILIDLLMFTFLTHYSGGSGASVRLHPLIFPNSYMNTGSQEDTAGAYEQ